MIRLIVALVGLAVFGAIFAGIYYAPENLEFKQQGVPAFNLAPGEVAQTTLPPTKAGTPILVQIRTVSPIDVYVMESGWSTFLPSGGKLQLDRPFSFDAAHSILGLNGSAEFSLISDGITPIQLVLDNSDNFYDGDTVPDLDSSTGGQASAHLTIRYLQEEQKSLMLGYLATIPSILLVVITLLRKARRRP
jgi:hypothetical protein